MSTSPSVDPVSTRPTGRPRSESARISILTAAYRLLKERPVQDVCAHDIAAEAGVSTATLYRWWPRKEAILLDAFLEVFSERVSNRPQASPLARLRERTVLSARFLRSEDGRVLARLMGAIQSDTQLRSAFLERFYRPRTTAGSQIVKDAIEAGELPPTTNARMLIEAIYGPQYLRLMIGETPLTDAEAARFFDLAISACFAISEV